MGFTWYTVKHAASWASKQQALWAFLHKACMLFILMQWVTPYLNSDDPHVQAVVNCTMIALVFYILPELAALVNHTDESQVTHEELIDDMRELIREELQRHGDL